MSEVGRQVGAVGVSELCGHIRNGERRILPEPLRRLGQSAHPGAGPGTGPQHQDAVSRCTLRLPSAPFALLPHAHSDLKGCADETELLTQAPLDEAAISGIQETG